jgi:hypothetical protein
MAMEERKDEGTGIPAASGDQRTPPVHIGDYVECVQDTPLHREEGRKMAGIVPSPRIPMVASELTTGVELTIKSGGSNGSPSLGVAGDDAMAGAEGQESAAFGEKQGLSVDIRDDIESLRGELLSGEVDDPTVPNATNSVVVSMAGAWDTQDIISSQNA